MPPTASSDVAVRLVQETESVGRPAGIYAVDGGILFVVEGVASYHIVDGSEILVVPFRGALQQNIRLYLLGSALGVLIHQRGLLPLHANCVEIDGAAFTFMGRSGSGKSTLAAWFHDRGFALLADDVSVVAFDGKERQAVVYPGVPRLRLWAQALEASGRSSADHPLSYDGDESYQKYDVIVEPEAAVREPRPLAAVYLLNNDQAFEISELHGVAAAEAIFSNTYRGAYVAMAGSSRQHWSACVELVRSTPVFSVNRRFDFDRLDEDSSRMLDHARSLAEARSRVTMTS